MSFDLTALTNAAKDLADAVAAKEQAQLQLTAAKAAAGDTQAEYQQQLAQLKAKYESDVADLNELYGKASGAVKSQVEAAEKAVQDATVKAATCAITIQGIVQKHIVGVPVGIGLHSPHTGTVFKSPYVAASPFKFQPCNVPACPNNK